MTKLYLVRHGETVDNVRQIMQGQTQGELTELGIEQARRLAGEMKNWDVDAFVASDLKRSLANIWFTSVSSVYASQALNVLSWELP